MVRVVADVPQSGAADGVLGADSDAESEEEDDEAEEEEDEESSEEEEDEVSAEAEQPRATSQVLLTPFPHSRLNFLPPTLPAFLSSSLEIFRFWPTMSRNSVVGSERIY